MRSKDCPTPAECMSHLIQGAAQSLHDLTFAAEASAAATRATSEGAAAASSSRALRQQTMVNTAASLSARANERALRAHKRRVVKAHASKVASRKVASIATMKELATLYSTSVPSLSSTSDDDDDAAAEDEHQQPPPLVVIVEDSDCFSVESLQAMLHSASLHTVRLVWFACQVDSTPPPSCSHPLPLPRYQQHHLPIAFVLGISATAAAFHRRMPRSVCVSMRIRSFHLQVTTRGTHMHKRRQLSNSCKCVIQSVVSIVDKIVEKLLVNGVLPLRVRPHKARVCQPWHASNLTRKAPLLNSRGSSLAASLWSASLISSCPSTCQCRTTCKASSFACWSTFPRSASAT